MTISQLTILIERKMHDNIVYKELVCHLFCMIYITSTTLFIFPLSRVQNQISCQCQSFGSRITTIYGRSDFLFLASPTGALQNILWNFHCHSLEVGTIASAEFCYGRYFATSRDNYSCDRAPNFNILKERSTNQSTYTFRFLI